MPTKVQARVSARAVPKPEPPTSGRSKADLTEPLLFKRAGCRKRNVRSERIMRHYATLSVPQDSAPDKRAGPPPQDNERERSDRMEKVPKFCKAYAAKLQGTFGRRQEATRLGSPGSPIPATNGARRLVYIAPQGRP